MFKTFIFVNMFKQRIDLEHDDFYLNEQGYKVFTEKYHLKRGHCCKSGCKHCPYGYDKKTDSFKNVWLYFKKGSRFVNDKNSNKMIKKILVLVIVIQFVGCAELQNVINNLPNGGSISQEQIGNGLRQALDNGIENQVSKLTSKNGFYKNELVKILLPQELQAVDRGLRKIGLSNLANEGVKVLNRAAEDAVKTATPIFVNAVKNITFADAKNILLGEQNAATSYLEGKTTTALYNQFSPVIKKSFQKVGADKIWNNLITKYNSIPFVTKVNPNLTDYVTTQALKGVFTMIEIEEKGIREKVGLRNTALLRQVFALQD